MQTLSNCRVSNKAAEYQPTSAIVENSFVMLGTAVAMILASCIDNEILTALAEQGNSTYKAKKNG